MNKAEIPLSRIPIAFATGSAAGVSSLSMSQVESLFSGEVTDWSELGGSGGAVNLVGREPSEALFTVLKEAYPSFNKAKFTKIFKKDHQVVKFLQSPAGASAIAFGAKPNFSDVNIVKVDDFSAGVAVGLVYDKERSEQPLVKAAQKFVATPKWSDAVKLTGLLPPN